MLSLLDRVEFGEDGGRLRSSGLEIEEVLAGLESGLGLGAVASQHSLEALDLVAALASLGLGPEGSEGPSLLKSQPKRPALIDALGEAELAAILPDSDRRARLSLSAGLLQILDFWDASHEAAQEADDLGDRRVSTYWHGIVHRREPDPGNASYWFRRVGSHEIFPDLGAAATTLLQAAGRPELTGRLASGGTWDPFAFIDFCGQAEDSAQDQPIARRLQRLEMDRLLLESWKHATA